MIGGTGPESTVDYYKTIIAEYKRRFPEGGIPPLLINSINFKRLMDFLEPQDWRGMAEMLAAEFQKLKDAGADFGLISANTPHICYKYLEPISPIPLVDVVDCALSACRGFRRIGLLGTKLTMESDFYAEAFLAGGIEVVVPNEEDREWVNRKYFDELFEGVFLAETRSGFEKLISKLAQESGIQAAVLGGTELPLILRDANLPVPMVDTAREHCLAAVEEIAG
jgi:aspartate racemase